MTASDSEQHLDRAPLVHGTVWCFTSYPDVTWRPAMNVQRKIDFTQNRFAAKGVVSGDLLSRSGVCNEGKIGNSLDDLNGPNTMGESR